MAYKISYIGGNCPVQAEGVIDGLPFYFRARGEHWSFRVAEKAKDFITKKIMAMGHSMQDGWIKARLLPSLKKQLKSTILNMDDFRTRFRDFEDPRHPFQKWWKAHGQYMMSGGGRREMICACRGWIAREQMTDGVEVTGDSLMETRPRKKWRDK